MRALALIREPLGLGDGHTSRRSASLGDVRLEREGTDEVVEAADDEPVRALLPGQGRASSTPNYGPSWVMFS